MGNAISEDAVWSLHGNVAELSCGNLSGRIDTTRPHAGLHVAELPDAGISNLLAVYRADATHERSWPLELAEAYVRGNDLVASYKPAADWPFSPQLYWRANSLRTVAGVIASTSLLVSVQTHLLDTCPRIGAASLMPGGESFLVTTSGNAHPRIVPIQQRQTTRPTNEDFCIVSRPRDSSVSYLEFMQSGDFQEISVRPDLNEIAVECQLFADFLEKGVIRRARVHVAILPRENDLERAAACCAAIEQLELPLTT